MQSFIVSIAVAVCLGAGSVRGFAAEATGPVYLFTSFRDADQKFLRFLYSFDGYNWTNVPGTFLEAKVGVSKEFRDPSLRAGRTEFFISSGRRAGTASRVSAAQIQRI